MSQWKKLLGDLNRDTQSAYSARPQKYTPKKRPYVDQSPSRFHNQTLQKINMSGMSEQKDKSLGRSFMGRQNEHENELKKMKASSSEVRLHKDLLTNPDRKMLLQPLESIALGLNQLERSNFQLRKPIRIGKTERSHLYQQVQKIKKQFGTFQSIVLRELQRQERLINSMFEEIIDKIKEENENSQRNYHILKNMKKDSDQDFKAPDILKAQSEIVNIKAFTYDQKKGINTANAQKAQKSVRCQNSEKNGHQFQRFFQAMENLKKNFNEINLISEISAGTSPKGEGRQASFEERQERFKLSLK